jgi:hypothetical protein
MTLPLYYANEKGFQGLQQSLKQLHCPHCGSVGTLNLHGFLRGYPEQDDDDEAEEEGTGKEDEKDDGKKELPVRGHRIFCSNRRRRCGCGRTCSVLLCGCLKRFLITLKTLWAFIAAVVAGTSKKAAFTSCCPNMHSSAAYRLYHRLDLAQIGFRSRLLRLIDVPPPPARNHPFADTLAHFIAAFPKSVTSPFADYQLTFQSPLL